jgi:hypothetical protein
MFFLENRRSKQISKFEASLVCKASSRAARDTQRNTILRKQRERERERERERDRQTDRQTDRLHCPVYLEQGWQMWG